MKKHRTIFFVLAVGLPIYVIGMGVFFNCFDQCLKSCDPKIESTYESLSGVDQEIFEEFMNDTIVFDDYNESCVDL